MAWIMLVASGVLEAVWATALGKSDGLRKPLPALVFGVALALSMGGLAYAARSIPIGTSYVVWVGIGAVLTVAYAVAVDGAPISALEVVFLAGIVVCVIGLKLAH